jgi:hypothetical protein
MHAVMHISPSAVVDPHSGRILAVMPAVMTASGVPPAPALGSCHFVFSPFRRWVYQGENLARIRFARPLAVMTRGILAVMRGVA